MSAAEAFLESLFVPGISQRAKALYRSFAKMARQRDFGLMEDELIILDTETTGLSFRNSEIIEIAAARVAGRVVIDRFQTYVKPKQPIPEEITNLTGITQEKVEHAQSLEEAIKNLITFVADTPIVAHNATFDRAFLEKNDKGYHVGAQWIDSLTLSRIALPALTSHRLADLARAFGCSVVSHSAMDDVDALFGVWRVIMCGLSSLPAGLLSRLAVMHPEITWPYRQILAHLALEKSGESFSLVNERREMVPSTIELDRVDAESCASLLVYPTEQDIQEAFAQGGIVSQMYANFAHRPEQLSMALEITKGISTSTHRCLEAGTGVGKTIAYAVPLAIFARANGITVGIATKTNALTDQLMSHELPALSNVLGKKLNYVSLKGYDHYPCLQKVERAMSAELPKSSLQKSSAGEAILTAIAIIQSYATQVFDGDLDSLGIYWKECPRSLVTTTSSECSRTRCPFYPRGCMLHAARRRAAAADIVVTNHSLLLCDIATQGKILPPIKHWVIDEAHGFEAEARRQWALRITSSDTHFFFVKLGNSSTGIFRGLLKQIALYENTASISDLVMQAVSQVISRSAQAQRATADLFDILSSLVDAGKSANADGAGYNNTVLWIGPHTRELPLWQRFEEAAHRASHDLGALYTALIEVNQAISDITQRYSADLETIARMIMDTKECIDIVRNGSQDTYVCSVEVTQARTEKNIVLLAEKFDIGAELAELWLSKMMSVTFTSATMTVDGSFDYFKHAVGLDKLDFSSCVYSAMKSSYDFDRAMLVVVARDMPDPGDSRYLSALEDMLFDIHKAMGGSALTLFTNRREMKHVHAGLKQRLMNEGLNVLCQHRGTSPYSLRQQFIEDKSLSLMALRSFWEGFDATGDTLRCVVIPRLPFSSPYDPLLCARTLRNQRAWWQYALPEAVIATKQAAGRLIRSENDRGVLILADSRLVTKRYGNVFISSMPSKTVAVVSSHEIGARLAQWCCECG